MSNQVTIGNRMMDNAYLRDGDVIHTGEALLLAMLVHAKGSAKRDPGDLHQVSKMMNDRNLNKKRVSRRR
jgi:hypothetical protein